MVNILKKELELIKQKDTWNWKIDKWKGGGRSTEKTLAKY